MKKRRMPGAISGFVSGKVRQQGFSLIEVLVALGILAAIAVIFLMGMSTSSQAAMVSQRSTTADSLAKSQMDSIKEQDYIKVADYNISDPDRRYQLINIAPDLAAQGYAINIPVPQNVTGGNENIQLVTVNITRNGDNIFTLTGYKVNR